MRVENGTSKSAYEVDCYFSESGELQERVSFTTKAEAIKEAKQRNKTYPFVEVNVYEEGSECSRLIWVSNKA